MQLLKYALLTASFSPIPEERDKNAIILITIVIAGIFLCSLAKYLGQKMKERSRSSVNVKKVSFGWSFLDKALTGASLRTFQYYPDGSSTSYGRKFLFFKEKQYIIIIAVKHIIFEAFFFDCLNSAFGL